MKLVVLLVGNSNESLLYIDMKRKMCEKLGILFQLHRPTFKMKQK